MEGHVSSNMPPPAAPQSSFKGPTEGQRQ
jgi:hypothetical protein